MYGHATMHAVAGKELSSSTNIYPINSTLTEEKYRAKRNINTLLAIPTAVPPSQTITEVTTRASSKNAPYTSKSLDTKAERETRKMRGRQKEEWNRLIQRARILKS